MSPFGPTCDGFGQRMIVLVRELIAAILHYIDYGIAQQ